ncbi:MAG TPA: hypothetical protein VE476_00125 [Propionibacteriaceae bacterium]|nr:hypothetical protein [Propionibacteriaceae bacterium]
MTIDYTGLGFVFATTDAADVLHRSEAEVHDMARAGMLPFLARPDVPGGPLRMWFHPDEVTRVEVMLRESVQRGGGLATDHRNRLRVQAALRAYLTSVTPLPSYDEAVLRNAPLLSRTRQRDRVVNVRPEAVSAHHNLTSTVPVTVSMIVGALEYFGAVRVRGVTALAEPGKQRWGIWFRLPAGFMSGDDNEAAVIDGILGGAYEPGERVRRRQGGPPHLAQPLSGMSDDASGTREAGSADSTEDDFDLDEEERAADRALAAELTEPKGVD